MQKKDKSIDETMNEIRQINRLKWRFMAWYQILFYPLTILINQWDNRQRSNPWVIYAAQQHDEPWLTIDRRKSENTWLRQIYNTTKLQVKYHMMPTTVVVSDKEAA